jgi:predicted permease
MLDSLTTIFIGVLMPILLITALGAIVHRTIHLDIRSLARLNIYLFVPGFLYIRLYRSTMQWDEIGTIALSMAIPMVFIGVILLWILRKQKIPGPTIGAVLLGSLVINAGNFGIPVAELLFGNAGGSVQALIVMFSNLSTWLFGYIILALAHGNGIRSALGYFKLPMIYVLVAAFVMRDFQIAPPAWLENGLDIIATAAVPIMLVTLGAQISDRFRWPRWRLILPVLGIKLMLLPIATSVAVAAFGLWPWPGAQIIVASAAPTALNTLLLTLELNGDADLAADCIFWNTLFSAATVTVVMTIVTTLGGGP